MSNILYISVLYGEYVKLTKLDILHFARKLLEVFRMRSYFWPLLDTSTNTWRKPSVSSVVSYLVLLSSFCYQIV